MNTNMVLEINYLKNGYDLTKEEYEKIQSEFESMEDCYDDLMNTNKSLSTNINNENVKLTKNVYYYISNNGNELHLSSILSSRNNSFSRNFNLIKINKINN